MNKIVTLLCIVGGFLSGSGAEITQIHTQNIRHAISQLRNTISNDIETAYYDFAAILGEIKTVQPDAERLQLMEELVAPLFDVQDDQWKKENYTTMTREKDYLLRLALETLAGDQYTVFKWECHLKRLKSMKKELALYADAEPPDEEALKKQLLQDFTEEIERRKAKAPGKPIVFSRSVSPPKEWRDAKARMGYKKWLESSIRFYEKDNFDALKFKIDYEDLPAAERQPLMERVRKELGRYPKWYKAERDETEKDGQSQAAGCDDGKM